MLAELSHQLLEENRELDQLITSLSEKDFDRVTAFFDWTVKDQILHLHQVDLFAMASLERRFDGVLQQVRADQARGIELSEQARRSFCGLEITEVLNRWRSTYAALTEKLQELDRKERLQWFGPTMSPVSMASARQMEVWAHGQDIYDLLEAPRFVSDRVRNVCDLGVRTFGWSFANRRLAVPARPDVSLCSPSGASWKWSGDGGGSIEGSALDFALVVTQRRAPIDTGLEARGAAAADWLAIAQCFAGAPQEPAAPGSRPRL